MSERLDDLQNGYHIYQETEDFCYGIDAVLLAHFAVMKERDSILDMGTGNGAVPLIMRAGAPEGVHFTGIEIQKKEVSLAKRSVSYNALEQDIDIVEGDLKEAASIFGAASFSLVTCNPPYMTENHGLINRTAPKAVARHELTCTLREIIESAAKVLETNGRFDMIHRPFRIAEIIRDLSEYGLEPKKLRFIFPFADKEPTMVLLEAVRGGKPRVKVYPPLIIYRAPGVYTDEILDIYGRNKA